MVADKPYCPLKVAFKGKEGGDTKCSSRCAWYLPPGDCAITVLAQVGFSLFLARKK